jgi:hypothetical protein
VNSRWLSADISIRAKSPRAGIKAEMVATFIVEPEAFMQRIFSLMAKMASSRGAKFQLHYDAVWPQI